MIIQLKVFTCLTGSRSFILHDFGRGSRGAGGYCPPPSSPPVPPLPPTSPHYLPPQNLCGAKLKLFGTTSPSMEILCGAILRLFGTTSPSMKIPCGAEQPQFGTTQIFEGERGEGECGAEQLLSIFFFHAMFVEVDIKHKLGKRLSQSL